jgi:hypothetical protein
VNHRHRTAKSSISLGLPVLDQLDGHEPGLLQDYLQRDLFAYANVPYRIKPYEELVRHPKETVDFDLHMTVEDVVQAFAEPMRRKGLAAEPYVNHLAEVARLRESAGGLAGARNQSGLATILGRSGSPS